MRPSRCSRFSSDSILPLRRSLVTRFYAYCMIANALEQRRYKELRAEHYGTARVVIQAYSKLFADCKDQMPLVVS
ncbi:unnamed protein product [Calypogeia fissa]